MHRPGDPFSSTTVESLEGVIRVEGYGVFLPTVQKGVGLADGVEDKLLELDHRACTPPLDGTPKSGDPGVTPDRLARETAQTARQRFQDLRILTGTVLVQGLHHEPLDQR